METQPVLTTIQVAGLLRSTGQTLRSEAEALGDEAMRWHKADGAWCVNEVLGHMIEAERRGFAGNILLILEEPGRTLETWDQEAVTRQRRDCERSGSDLLREFASMRGESVRRVERILPEQLELAGEHVDVGSLRVVDLLHEWVHHDRAHVKQAFENVQAYVWPHMGNAQRFSESAK